jgi:hypothetical protein
MDLFSFLLSLTRIPFRFHEADARHLSGTLRVLGAAAISPARLDNWGFHG